MDRNAPEPGAPFDEPGGLFDVEGDIDWQRVEALIARYGAAAPRYTSYPTAPTWSADYGVDAFRRDLACAAGDESAALSLYAHVPFCRTLCHFCACNRVITQRPELPERYLEAIERECAALREAWPAPPRAVQLHWGGGTPTHLEPAQIRRLFAAIDDAFPLAPDAEISIEADPRVTSDAHVESLRACGFERLSLGVQDFDPRVQQAIHREQSVEQTAGLVERARACGFEGVNLDLIYGLPYQTPATFERTLDAVLAIRPERVALYGYAHVTWVAKQQRGFERGDLPAPGVRLRILVGAIERFLAAGYVYIGMDHFALPDDPLARALRDRTLRRNFMGYTTRAGTTLLGVGPSAISELPSSYAQSERDLGAWEAAVRAGAPATVRGHALSADDRERRWLIARLMCLGGVEADEYRAAFGGRLAARYADELQRLEPLAEDGLVDVAADGSLRLTGLGRLLVRPVAAVFDAYLPRQLEGDRPVFSATV
ncbi:MAG: oxygen-independent coproporphyrinogen III oxidase [Myxococcota bacterium]|nr:oxygen-independent coproporphyrinogen III oxidase [Myxococcota bacterium]